MYLGVDIGGTKTLAAVLNNDGVIVEQDKFPTPKNYDDFINQLSACLALFKHKDFMAATVAVPGLIDRKHGGIVKMSNLPWKNEPIVKEVEKLTKCPTIVENDANLAGLSEAMLAKKYSKVLYVTVSTGIGTGFIVDQKIEPALADSEGGHILLPYHSKLMEWEKFASGRAIYEHFGKFAADIPASDTKSWAWVARNLAVGFLEHSVAFEPDVIIVGGSIGTYFDRYGELLKQEMKKYDSPMVRLPEVLGAKRAEQAVAYGCYDLAKQKFGSHAAAAR